MPILLSTPLSTSELEKNNLLKSQTEIPLTAQEQQLTSELNQIFSDKKISQTEKDVQVKARIHQSNYRKNLLKLWNYQCAVTGFDLVELLIASHIKPWRATKMTATECLDVNNGLLLIPNLDKAFDQGYISFSDDGKILLSPYITATMLDAFGLSTHLRLRQVLNNKQKHYLAYHRQFIFKAK